MWGDIKRLMLAFPFDFIAYFLLLLPVILSVYRQKFLTRNLVAVSTLFLARFLEDTVLNYYAMLNKFNLDQQRGFFIIDVILLTVIYYLSFSRKNSVTRFVLFFAFISVTFLSLNYLFYRSLSGGSFFSRLTYIIFSLLYFNEILAENRIKNVLKHPMFWVSAGFLFFGMGTFMTTLFTDYLLDPSKTPYATYELFMNMNQIVSWIQCLLVAIGLWVSKFDKDNYIQFT